MIHFYCLVVQAGFYRDVETAFDIQIVGKRGPGR